MIIAEPAQILEALYNQPPILEKTIRTGLINELQMVFEDFPTLLSDFTKVKQLYEKYGSVHMLDILSRPDISDAQIPAFYDRQTQKYTPPCVVVWADYQNASSAILASEFVPAVRDYISHVRTEKLQDINNRLRDEVLDRESVKVHSIVAERDMILGRIKQDVAVRDWSEIVDENDAYGEKPKIFTGIESIDESVLMREGNILTIGATPGGGKTSMVNQMIIHWMLPENNKNDHSCLYFSLENDGRETQKFMTDYMNSLPDYYNQPIKIKEAMKRFRLSYCSDLFDANDIIERIHRKIAQDPRLKYVVLDFIQLVRDRTIRDGSEYKVCTRTMELLKELKNKNLFIVVLSQFDKASAKEREEPTMYSLKGAGAIAELSSYILINMRAKGEEVDGMIDVMCHVVKSRHSRKCKLPMKYCGSQKRFYPVEESE